MQQTLKYIRVLNWAYSGFSPMTIGADFGKSLQQLQERLCMLDGLDEGALFVEAKSPQGKANLLDYTKAGNDFGHGLHFMRDRVELMDALPTMFQSFKDEADRLRAAYAWSDEQWREYRVTLAQIGKGIENRLRQFAAAYGYRMDGEQPQPRDLHYYCYKAIERGYLVKVGDGYRRTKELSKAQLSYFLGHFLKPDGTFPDAEFCVLFGESRLSKALSQLADNKNGGGKPMGYEMVDELLQE